MKVFCAGVVLANTAYQFYGMTKEEEQGFIDALIVPREQTNVAA